MLVTVGATEAIAAAVLGLVEPGSEVLLIEPFYDSYSPVVAMAGAHRLAVPLVPDGRGFALDTDALRRALTPRTRALIINSPHNPTGAVLSEAELAAVAEIAVAADLLVITDEVYEHLVFDGHRHLPLAGFDGMAERTITISSAAKMFNCTGWKIGWACGPAELIAGVRAAKQYLSYVGGAPFQPAVALALDTEDAWVAELRSSLQARRDRLASRADRDRLREYTTAMAVTSCAPIRVRWAMTTARRSARHYREKVGVAAIPMSAFCDPAAPHAWSKLWNHLVRFTFCKREDTLDEAIRRLGATAGLSRLLAGSTQRAMTRRRSPSVAACRTLLAGPVDQELRQRCRRLDGDARIAPGSCRRLRGSACTRRAGRVAGKSFWRPTPSSPAPSGTRALRCR